MTTKTVEERLEEIDCFFKTHYANEWRGCIHKQLTEAIADARRQQAEEDAKICDRFFPGVNPSIASDCAKAIRANAEKIT